MATRADHQTVLIVDDDVRTQRLLERVFGSHGFKVLVASDGDTVLRVVRSEHPAAVVLDLRMPKVPGLEVLRGLRKAGEEIPVVVLTGVLDEDVILAAFEAGADDYVTKPFQPRVLVARVHAVIRRQQRGELDAAWRGGRAGEVVLDPRTRQVHVGGQSVALSPTEYQLLRTLMQSAGRVFTPADLLNRVWGPGYVGQDEIVRANIYRLRHKLEPDPSRPRYIKGRRGVGYYFADKAESATGSRVSSVT